MRQTNDDGEKKVKYTFGGVLMTTDLPFTSVNPVFTKFKFKPDGQYTVPNDNPIIDDDEPDFPIIADGE